MIFTINLLNLNLTFGIDQGRGSSWHGRVNLFGFIKIKAAHFNPSAPFLAGQDVAQCLAWGCLVLCIPCKCSSLCLPSRMLQFEGWTNGLEFKILD